MGIIGVFILKIIDNMLGTAKTIYINKEKYLLGSLFNAGATFFYMVAIVELTKDSSLKSIIAMCIATFIGTYLPGIVINKSERDKLYIFDITSDTMKSGKSFADKIRAINLPIKTYTTYDSNMNKTLSCKVYCSTKEESRIVNDLIKPKFKFNVYVPVE